MSTYKEYLEHAKSLEIDPFERGDIKVYDKTAGKYFSLNAVHGDHIVNYSFNFKYGP